MKGIHSKVSTVRQCGFFPCFILFLSLTLWHTAADVEASDIPQTGQTVSFTPGDDGSLQTGVTWPIPRFMANGDGTVTDQLTGRMWLENANCFGESNWQQALNNGTGIGNGDCGLADGSTAGQWRLANVRELQSILHLGFSTPSVPNTQGSGQAEEGNPFVNLQSSEYWSSTTSPHDPENAYSVIYQFGHTVVRDKTTTRFAAYIKNNGLTSPPAEVYATGQTTCYSATGTTVDCAATGQDGEIQSGKTWPFPRFTDRGDGTIFDQLTRLTWLKDANCFNLSNWSGAIGQANILASGTCSLTDGSRAGDWRLPNRNELASLIDFSNSSPALSNTDGTGPWGTGDPFTNVQTTAGYWTSTTYEPFTNNSWYIDFLRGVAGTTGKTDIAYLLPVRDDQEESLEVTINGSGNGTVTSSPAGIVCPGVCLFDFARNSIVTLTANTQSGTRFVRWSLESCGTNKSCQVTMSAAQSVSADFTDKPLSVAHWLLLLMN